MPEKHLPIGTLFIVCPIHGRPYSLTYGEAYPKALMMERALSFQEAHRMYCNAMTEIKDVKR